MKKKVQLMTFRFFWTWWMWKIATTSMSVFRNLDCLSLIVCSSATLLKLQNVLFLLFSKFCASKSGVRLIYGCGLYTDVYSNKQFTCFSTCEGSGPLHRMLISLVDYKLAGPPKLSNGPPNFSRRGPEDPIIWKPGYISAYLIRNKIPHTPCTCKHAS